MEVKHTIKTKCLLFLIKFFRAIYLYFEKLLDKEWERLMRKKDKADSKKDRPALIYDSRKIYNQTDIHSGLRKDE